VLVSESSEMPIASSRSPKLSGTEVETQPAPLEQVVTSGAVSVAVR